MAKKKTAKKTSKQTSTASRKAAGSTAAKKTKTSGKSAAAASSAAGGAVKKTARKATGAQKSAKTTKKKTAAKTTARTTAAKKTTTKKKTESKPKTESKKTTSAKAEPAATRKTSSAASKKAETRKPQPAAKEAPKKPETPASQPAKPDDADKGRKGITVVEKKRSTRQKAPPVQFPSGGRLLAPGGPQRKPLIPSGPANIVDEPDVPQAVASAGKSPFNKRQLEKFRSMLTDKRQELLGDITGLESEALKSADGSDPRLGEHLEDQGSDAIDQAVSLDLAAADRRLLRMIDEALDRIENGTYGLCTMTGNPIREERLQELPWASLSIEAARAEERRQMGRL